MGPRGESQATLSRARRKKRKTAGTAVDSMGAGGGMHTHALAGVGAVPVQRKSATQQSRVGGGAARAGASMSVDSREGVVVAVGVFRALVGGGEQSGGGGEFREPADSTDDAALDSPAGPGMQVQSGRVRCNFTLQCAHVGAWDFRSSCTVHAPNFAMVATWLVIQKGQWSRGGDGALAGTTGRRARGGEGRGGYGRGRGWGGAGGKQRYGRDMNRAGGMMHTRWQSTQAERQQHTIEQEPVRARSTPTAGAAFPVWSTSSADECARARSAAAQERTAYSNEMASARARSLGVQPIPRRQPHPAHPPYP